MNLHIWVLFVMLEGAYVYRKSMEGAYVYRKSIQIFLNSLLKNIKERNFAFIKWESMVPFILKKKGTYGSR